MKRLKWFVGAALGVCAADGLAHNGPWRFDGTAQQRVSVSAEAVPDLGSTNRAWSVMMEIRPDRDMLDRLDAYGKMFLKLSVVGMYTALTDGQWHLVALTFDPDRMVSTQRPQGHHWYTTYVDPQCPTSACHVVSHDGTRKGRLEFLMPISTKRNSVILGGPLGYREHTVPYKGEMRNVRVFDRLLSEEEIKVLGTTPSAGLWS